MNQWMSNIRKFYFFRFFTIFTVTNPILTYYMLVKGLSVGDIFILSGIQRIFGILVEVPTGALSDTRGHKYNLMLGTSSFVVSCLLFAFGHTFVDFMWAEIFMALCGGFISGADTAFVYESLERCGQQERYEKVFGQGKAIQSVVTAVIMLMCGFLAEKAWVIPFYITAAFGFIAFIISCTFTEPATVNKTMKTNTKDGYYEYFKRLRTACKISFTNVELRWFLVYASLLSVGIASIDDFYQVYMKNGLGSPVAYATIVYALLYVGQAIFSNYTGEGLKKLGYDRMFFLLPFLGVITALGMALFKSELVLILFVLPYVSTGFTQTVVSGYINRRTNPGQRATVMSLRTMMRKVIYAFFTPAIGWVCDKYGLDISLFIIAVLLIGTLLIPFFYKRKYNLDYELPHGEGVATSAK